jgi:glycosyltransferase involved in cell wall biosynthesis
MRVLQINSVCGIRSTGRIATDIHQTLLSQHNESTIAYGRFTPQNCGSVIRIGSDLDNYRHVALTKLTDLHGFGSRMATWRFIEKVKALDPDIIHLHNIHGYYINVEILFDYLKKAGKPVVWTLHDCWAFTGHCSYFDYAGCDRWKTGCFSCPQKRDYPESLLIDNSRNNYSKKKAVFNGVKNLTIVTPSKWLADLVRQSFLAEYPVQVINNGIDLDVFRPVSGDFKQKQHLEGKHIILGLASIWDRRKGLKHFVAMAPGLRADETIVLIGLSEQQIRDLPPGILGIPRTNSAGELAEIYSAADVFVNPTSEDNFPTTNLESLACGTPVITFDTGGSVESISPGCGIVVKKEESETLLDRIRETLSQDRGIQRANCTARARSLYDKSGKNNEYIKLYSLIANQAAE